MRRVLLVGDPGATHVGGHLHAAAAALGIDMHVCDVRQAYEGGSIRRRLLWHLAGHRPARLRSFSDHVVATAREVSPTVLLATGLAPIDRRALETLATMGVRLINFLTDDPWNPAHRAPWFLEALPRYDHVWTPRVALVDDLARAGVPSSDYLPFAYNPLVHYYQPADATEAPRYDADVLIAGGADADRVAIVAPLIRAGMRVALYGGYWDRFPATRTQARGMLDAEGLRKATSSARLCLGLVRRANRDTHSMRTFEVPAMRGCLLAEDTGDHRRFYGAEGETVLFFQNGDELVEKTRRLLTEPGERQRLSAAVHQRITQGGHTYADRLPTMIGLGAAS